MLASGKLNACPRLAYGNLDWPLQWTNFRGRVRGIGVPTRLSIVFVFGSGGALSGSLPASKHTIAGGAPPGKLYAGRSIDTPVLAL
jgi:hypothetical protein